MAASAGIVEFQNRLGSMINVGEAAVPLVMRILTYYSERDGTPDEEGAAVSTSERPHIRVRRISGRFTP